MSLTNNAVSLKVFDFLTWLFNFNSSITLAEESLINLINENNMPMLRSFNNTIRDIAIPIVCSEDLYLAVPDKETNTQNKIVSIVIPKELITNTAILSFCCNSIGDRIKALRKLAKYQEASDAVEGINLFIKHYDESELKKTIIKSDYYVELSTFMQVYGANKNSPDIASILINSFKNKILKLYDGSTPKYSELDIIRNLGITKDIQLSVNINSFAKAEELKKHCYYTEFTFNEIFVNISDADTIKKIEDIHAFIGKYMRSESTDKFAETYHYFPKDVAALESYLNNNSSFSYCRLGTSHTLYTMLATRPDLITKIYQEFDYDFRILHEDTYINNSTSRGKNQLVSYIVNPEHFDRVVTDIILSNNNDHIRNMYWRVFADIACKPMTKTLVKLLNASFELTEEFFQKIESVLKNADCISHEFIMLLSVLYSMDGYMVNTEWNSDYDSYDSEKSCQELLESIFLNNIDKLEFLSYDTFLKNVMNTTDNIELKSAIHVVILKEVLDE